MLVIVSDLHLTDGRDPKSTNVKTGAFKVFRQRLSDMAYDASWRSETLYKPILRLDVVLLGDILDPIRSDKWLDTDENNAASLKPWSDRGPEFVRVTLHSSATDCIGSGGSWPVFR